MNRLILLSLYSVLFAQDLQLKQIVISSGAVQSDRLKGTLGQPVVGTTISDNYFLSVGFWGSISQMFLNVDGEAVMPTEYVISKAYPNPFNPVTNIDIAVPESGLMQFAIYDILGRQVLNINKPLLTPAIIVFHGQGKTIMVLLCQVGCTY